ncbi:hypothetical protein ACP70R_040935 [Stipagrostis hirtigluma subsp. patula]
MELAMGAIGVVLPRLQQLLTEEYQLQKSAKKNIESLSRELAAIQVALEKVAKVPADQLEPDTKLWASNARELSYDIDDALDRFFVRTAGGEHGLADLGFLKKFARKTKGLLKNAKARREISDAISDIRELAKAVAELRKRYKVDGPVANHASTTVDPRIIALHKDMTEVIGIDQARDEVISMLSGHSDELKVVSIVGFGGLGKTTLARAVHDQLKGQFCCGAFVSVGQNPDLKKVFKDTLHGLDDEKYKDIHNTTMDENLLVGVLRNFLQDKKYFVIIDDIWDEKVWEYIECAFYKNNLGSQIITTTRNFTVSKACCSNNDDGIYRMKPLSGDDSKRLFYKRIFQHENGCPQELEEVSKDILKKCDGVPLAIITIAGLLANKKVHTRHEWCNVLNSIGRGLKGGHKVEDMKKILSFSYYDLPPQLKACLLYLSIFPEDSKIDRDHLVRIWIAESVVRSTTSQHENMLVDLGHSYFSELINRSMLQPANTDHSSGSVISCRVHDMVLELIIDLSKEENFVTILDHERDTSLVGKVHRLSLQNSKAKHTVPDATVRNVRSLYAFSSSINILPAVSSFPVLRVLDLDDDCDFEGSYHLKHLGKLFHLRYLRIRCKSIKELPIEIGNLEFLQTLDLIGSSIKELPPTIVRLRRLMFLRFENAITLSDRIGALTSLQELSPEIRIDDYPSALSFLKALDNLTELRVLSIIFSSGVIRDKVVLQSLCSLRNLRKLLLRCGSYSEGVVLSPLCFGSPLDLQYLSCIVINAGEVHQENIENLGRLPALRVLEIWKTGRTERWVIGCGAFPCLEHCSFISSKIRVVFKSGAMPKVCCLDLGIVVEDYRDINFDCGLGNLPSLQQVDAWIVTGEAQDWEAEEINKVLTHTAQIHPKHPKLRITRDW